MNAQINLACCRFEDDFRAGGAPRIEDVLGSSGLAGAEADELLDELIRVELELRAGRGESPSASEYRVRFPDRSDVVTRALAAVGVGATMNQEAATPTLADANGAARRGLPTIDGFLIEEELGRGGMGVVYRAWSLALRRKCALKMLLHPDCVGSRGVSRLLEEARIMAELGHPHIVPIYAIGTHEGTPFLEMEYLPGGNLARQLDGTPWPSRRAATLGRTLAEAVAAAHDRGVIHRDLKPANVLLDAQGGPKVADFGLARSTSADAADPSTGVIFGTPGYMAPEQAAGEGKSGGPGIDIFTLGVILYEMVAGRPPFRGPNAAVTLDLVRAAHPVPPRQLVPGVPRDLETIVLKCLQKEPRRRYDSAWALAEDLGRFLQGRSIAARPVSMTTKLGRWCRRNPVIATAATTTALALLALAIVSSSAAWRLDQARIAEAWERRLAEQARRQAVGRLAESRLNEARAVRLAGRPGARAQAVELLHDAKVQAQAGGRDTATFTAQLRDEMFATITRDELAIAEERPSDVRIYGAVTDARRDRVASVSRGDRLEVRDRTNRRLAAWKVGHFGGAFNIHLMAGGDWIVWNQSLTDPHTRIRRQHLHVWALRPKRLLWTWSSTNPIAWTVAPKGDRLLILEEGQAPRWFDPRMGTWRAFGYPIPFRTNTQGLQNSLSLAPDERHLAVVDPQGGAVRIFETRTGRLERQVAFHPPDNRVSYFALGLGLRLVSYQGNAVIRLDDPDLGPAPRTLRHPGVTAMALHPSGDRLAVFDSAQTLTVRRLPALTAVASADVSNLMIPFQFLGDPAWIGPEFEGGRMRWRRLDEPGWMRTWLPNEQVSVPSWPTLAPDGCLWAVGQQRPGHCEIHDGDRLIGQINAGHFVRFTSEGDLISWLNGQILRWRQRPAPESVLALEVGVVASPGKIGLPIDVAADGSQFAILGGYGECLLFATDGSGRHRKFEGQQVTLSHDGATLAGLTRGQLTVRAQRVADPRGPWEAPLGPEQVFSLTPDGQLMAAHDGKGWRWLALGSATLPGPIPVQEPGPLAFRRDFSLAAIGTGRVMTLFEPWTGAIVARWDEPTEGTVQALTFSDDGSHLLARFTRRGMVRIWNLQGLFATLLAKGLIDDVPGGLPPNPPAPIAPRYRRITVTPAPL